MFKMAAPMNSSSSNMSKLVSAELQKLLDEYGIFTVLEAREKIRCELSGHEMPCRIDTLESYVKGKKFKKLWEKHQYQYEKQHLTHSNKRGREHQLFCTLTLRHINNTPKHIQKHLDGRRFKKALARWTECQKTGEVFKPYRPKQRQETDIPSEADDSNHGDDAMEDDLDDLYPAQDFEDDSDKEVDSDIDMGDSTGERLTASTQDQSESDYDFDDLENVPKNSVDKVDVTVTKVVDQKRKFKGEAKKQKKLKT